MKAIALALLGVALALAGYGVWLITIEDLQGGRDAVGGIFLAASAIAAFLGSLALWGGRRRG